MILALRASAQTNPGVTSKVVPVSNRKYTVYDYAGPATKKFCVVIPEGLKTVRGLLVQCNYAGGDPRGEWTSCHYYLPRLENVGVLRRGEETRGSYRSAGPVHRDEPDAGYHTFSVLGMDAAGTVRTSDPVMVVVRSPQQ